MTDACGDLFMFKAIAEKVGKNLTVKNWQKTVNSFGKIDLPPDEFASLCKGKYDGRGQLPAGRVRLEPRVLPATGRR